MKTHSKHRFFVWVAFCGLFNPTGSLAAERATIVNDAGRNVEFFLKWSGPVPESPLIVLAPGESRSVTGHDGEILEMRYNSTPGRHPARERFVTVITAQIHDRSEAGFVSHFRAVNPYIVEIFDH